MEPLIEILRGPYAYLLIAQIVIVALLCLTMVWLIFQRMREMPPQTTTVNPLSASAISPSVAVKTTVPSEVLVTQSAPAASSAEIPPTDTALTNTPPEPQAENRVSALSDVAAEPQAAAPVTPPPPADAPRAGGDNSQEALNLREQIRYLESKLLEYEIVQEEISTLSSLKTQNEELKQQIAQLEEQARAKSIEPTAPTATEIPPENGPRSATG